MRWRWKPQAFEGRCGDVGAAKSFKLTEEGGVELAASFNTGISNSPGFDMHSLRMVLLSPLQQMINAERGNESNAMVDGE
jgi:hypothetical protein